jgi:hypothetical protein
MESVYCAVRTGALNKVVCAWCMMKSVYCAVRTGDFNNAVCAWCTMKSVYCAVQTWSYKQSSLRLVYYEKCLLRDTDWAFK